MRQASKVAQQTDCQLQLGSLNRGGRNDAGDILQQLNYRHAGSYCGSRFGITSMPRAGTYPVLNHVRHWVHFHEGDAATLTEVMISAPTHNVPDTLLVVVRGIGSHAKCAIFKFGAEHGADSLPRVSPPVNHEQDRTLAVK